MGPRGHRVRTRRLGRRGARESRRSGCRRVLRAAFPDALASEGTWAMGVAMTDDRDLRDLDPYDAFDREAERIHRFFTSIDDPTWKRSTRCEGWSVRDVLSHLRATEDYNQATLDGRLQELLGEWGARGATDLDSANALGVAEFASAPTDALIEEWRNLCGDTGKRLRDRDGGEIDSSVGAYPA